MISDALPEQVLAAAVEEIGGRPRLGQQHMVAAVTQALNSGVHLLVQAGTGTGKSLGYLAPALVYAAETGQRVVVATATLALQSQLANKDIPAVLDAVEKVLGCRPRTAIVKGRGNYACLQRVRDGVGEDQESLISAAELARSAKASGVGAEGVLGAEVLALREWAEQQAREHGHGERDDAPPHGQQAWAQVSVPVRECLSTKCPYYEECFAEQSRTRARQADVVVTNHALLAIDAMHGGTALPEHGCAIIDEAHELVSRVSSAASVELSSQAVERVAKRTFAWLDDDLSVELLDVGDTLEAALNQTEPGRVLDPDSAVVGACQSIRDVARRTISALNQPGDDVARVQASAAVKEVFDIAERMAALADADVIWVSESERYGRRLNAAPLSVAGLMRDRVLGNVTTVLTSATLMVGGGFESTAGSVGLRRGDRIELDAEPIVRVGEFTGAHKGLAGAGSVDTGLVNEGLADGDVDPGQTEADEVEAPTGLWRAIDVGSPFDYAKQGILYVGRELPNPGREGIGAQALEQLAELVWAAGGHTLGLFASQRSADMAARHVRMALPQFPVLCQGDAQLSELTKRFLAEPQTCLFGTMSLWQGIDVPGETCQLVVIDKIPFPRPDDPLTQARQQAVAEAGGNGFMAVAATHAGLLLAQGSGRLIRRLSDRGVVAILDPRLVTARYGSFLRASMPDFWSTTDLEVAVQALQRLQKARTTSENGVNNQG